MSKTLIAARIALIGVLATLWPVTALSSDLSSLDAPIANILQRGGLEVRENKNVDKKKTSANTAQSFSSSKVTNGNGTGTEIAYQAQGLIIIFASDEAKQLSENNSPPPQKLIDLIAEISGEHITFSRAMSMGAFVFSLDTPLSRESLKPILERLRKHPLIELASPDGLADTSFVPNDTYFGRQWPLFGFNDYWPLGGEYVIGINAIDAWNITTGSSDVVIAVVDTGIVNANGFGPGRVLPGYDFISDPIRANDGDGRDANPADPGNYSLPGECSEDSIFKPSSWHGTHVAGTIGAPANNNAGIAGVDWRAKILPVRVLGKCGGSLSDIVDGLRWSAGLSVPGVPNNPNPADIINMSLGGFSPGGCSGSAIHRAINEIKGSNTLIVVAAGNDDKEAAQYIPASCDGVLTVGAVDHKGYRASYSNYSVQNKVYISAPGGDYSRYGPEEYGVLSIVDAGTTTPSGNFKGSYYQGTSMAAPHVSGVASLALAVDSDQSVQMIQAIMGLTSSPFNQESKCTEYYPLCGEGIVNAYETVTAIELFKPFTIVWGFYNADLDHFFRTGGIDEANSVFRGEPGFWIDTEDYFLGWRDESLGALPVCRFYGTPGIGPNSHFYTVDPEECEYVKEVGVGWSYEGTAFYSKMPINGVCPSETMPIYRYYNQRWQENDSNHRYATHLRDKEVMVADGWVLEGVAMCAPGG